MRRNRKVSRKQSVVGMHAMHLGVMLLTLLAAVIVNQCASASCDRLLNKIGEKERVLKRKTAELRRVTAGWEAATSKDGLQKALDDWSIVMRPASPDHVVRVDGGGSFDRRQRSVRLVRNRMSSLARIDAAPPSAVRRTVRR